MSGLPQRRIGDLDVSAIGMGAMTLTQVPDADVARGQRAVAAAVESGITLFDTADSYGTGEYGQNELALVTALRRIPGAMDRVIIATKGGHTRHENASWWIDGSAEHLAKAARDSAHRLGLDALPLYQHHRPDPRIPYRESMEALCRLVADGVVVRVGVSNVDRDQLLMASEILGSSLVSVQNELSPVAPDRNDIAGLAADLGIAFLAWGPLGGMRGAKQLGDAAAPFAAVASRRGISPQRVALAWLLARGPHVIPIPGASRPESVLDSVAALDLELTQDELAALDGAQ